MATNSLKAKSSGAGFKNYMRRYWVLYAMLLLPIVYFIVFKYIPFLYIQIAFKDYKIGMSPFAMPWAKNKGMFYFQQAFRNRDFRFALRNTIMLNGLDLLVGFPAPIILAIILNEIKCNAFKRVTQTIAYLPHFLSWIIISGLALQVFAPTTGLVNIALNAMGYSSKPFLNDPTNWVVIYILLGVWQSVGWNTIIYFAAITSINTELYEAAEVDGAGRLRKIWHITLPGLRPTIVVLLILSLGNMLGIDFARPFSLQNNLVKSVSNVLSTFVYTNGIRGLQISMTTAVGLFQSVVNVIFLSIANLIAKRLGENGIW